MGKRRLPAKLVLGPVLFNWEPAKWRDFYFRIADEAPVESVCVGEVVCAKRLPFVEPLIDAVVERLKAAKKDVVRSTLALVVSDRELETVRRLAAQDSCLVEANDIAALSLLAGRPFAVGPFVNVYNEATLSFVAAKGAVRVCLAVELPARSIAALGRAGGPELEVQAYGRLPLALSARCFHARSRGLHKDGCQYVCAEDPDGMTVKTLDGAPFLAVNGTQTLSYAYGNYLAELDELGSLGVRRFRLSPQDVDMVGVARIFRDVLDGRTEPEAGSRSLAELGGNVPFCNGFYHGAAGMALASRRGEDRAGRRPASGR